MPGDVIKSKLCVGFELEINAFMSGRDEEAQIADVEEKKTLNIT